jgi:hypothetical protein
MPPPTEAGPVPVELGPLRELLAVDRRGAGEARKQLALRELQTAAYSMPLHVQWRRALRRHRRLRVMAWSAGLSIVSALGLWQGPALLSQIGSAVSWAERAAGPTARLWIDGAMSWAERTTGTAPRLWFDGAVSWAERTTGTAPRLWLHCLTEDELRASERGPGP